MYTHDIYYFVYILASKRNGTLYIGITNNLKRRVYEHKEGLIAGFTKNYGVHALVYFELYDNPTVAINREKQLKKWNRKWKIELIESIHNGAIDIISFEDLDSLFQGNDQRCCVSHS